MLPPLPTSDAPISHRPPIFIASASAVHLFGIGGGIALSTAAIVWRMHLSLTPYYQIWKDGSIIKSPSEYCGIKYTKSMVYCFRYPAMLPPS